MSKGVVVTIEPEHINAATAAAVLDVCERSFYELVKAGKIRAVKIPDMRRTTYSLAEVRALARSWRGE